MKTDTPRTDAVYWNFHTHADIGSLARELERELTEKNNEVARLRELLKRAIDSCECDYFSSNMGSYCDCGRYWRNAEIRKELAALKQGKVFVDPKGKCNLETQLAKAHEEVCEL